MITAKRIAIIAEGDIYDRKGMFNALVCRSRYFAQCAGCETSVFFLSTYEPWYVRLLRHTSRQERVRKIEVDGLELNVIWQYFTLIDYFFGAILHRNKPIQSLWLRKQASLVRDYDFVIAHSFVAGQIASRAKERWNIPFSITWHGSDIHLYPFVNQPLRRIITSLIEQADLNCFVSENLKSLSERLTTNGRKIVLYNAADASFRDYGTAEKARLRQEHGVSQSKVVAYIGNFVDVKNVLALPRLFAHMYAQDDSIVFWAIGDGKLRPQVEAGCKSLPVRFWGNLSPQQMPDMMNCVDVVVLPSKNEGLPLVLVEALQCGCHAVGSRQGGIPEVIGIENTFALDDKSFVPAFCDRVLYFLHEGSSERQSLPDFFSWERTAQAEEAAISEILHSRS